MRCEVFRRAQPASCVPWCPAQLRPSKRGGRETAGPRREWPSVLQESDVQPQVIISVTVFCAKNAGAGEAPGIPIIRPRGRTLTRRSVVLVTCHERRRSLVDVFSLARICGTSPLFLVPALPLLPSRRLSSSSHLQKMRLPALSPGSRGALYTSGVL